MEKKGGSKRPLAMQAVFIASRRRQNKLWAISCTSMPPPAISWQFFSVSLFLQGWQAASSRASGCRSVASAAQYIAVCTYLGGSSYLNHQTTRDSLALLQLLQRNQGRFSSRHATWSRSFHFGNTDLANHLSWEEKGSKFLFKDTILIPTGNFTYLQPQN